MPTPCVAIRASFSPALPCPISPGVRPVSPKPLSDRSVVNIRNSERFLRKRSLIFCGQISAKGYQSVARQLKERFGFEKVAITLRTSISASDNEWQGMLYDGATYCLSRKYRLHIVDRVGGGDSFGAGLIYALVNGYDAQNTIEFAVAASALKHTVEGDFNRVSVKEVQKLADGDASGRVQR